MLPWIWLRKERDGYVKSPGAGKVPCPSELRVRGIRVHTRSEFLNGSGSSTQAVTYHFAGTFKQPDRDSMQPLAGFFGSFSGAGASVGPFVQNAQLETSEHGVPFDRSEIARGLFRIAGN